MTKDMSLYLKEEFKYFIGNSFHIIIHTKIAVELPVLLAVI